MYDKHSSLHSQKRNGSFAPIEEGGGISPELDQYCSTQEQSSEVRTLRMTQSVLSSLQCADTLLLQTRNLAVFAQRICDLVEQNKVLQNELQHHKHALNQHAIVSKTDRYGKITDVNGLFCSLSGYSREELIGADHKIVKSQMHSGDFWSELWSVISGGEVWHGEVCNRHKSGSFYWVKSTIVPVFDAQGHVQEYISIRTDITQRKQVERELEAAKDIAERASQAKSVFLANMSHEIRTPLNAMLGLTQLLERGFLDNDQRDIVQRVGTAGQVLLRNLNDVLDFSKIESGQMSLRPHDFCLNQVLSNVYKMQHSMAKAVGLKLSLELCHCDFYVRGDDIRLSQILLNLTNNAIKFTHAGQVVIRAQLLNQDPQHCRVRFEVSDTGIGIPANKIQALFQPFTQVEHGSTRRFGGTGLGLSICKSLVILMGGKLGVQSTETRGSTFWFELPFEIVQTQQEAPHLSADDWVFSDAPTKRLDNKNILVVDDNEMNRYMVQHILRLEGARTAVAVNGQQAVEMLVAEPMAFDAVLMDIQMPVMDGLDATRLIRNSLGMIELPVIICSAGVQAEDKALALAAGATEFMIKPINLDVLVDSMYRATRPRTAVAVPIDHAQSAALSGLWVAVRGIDGLQMWQKHAGDAVSYQIMLALFCQEVKEAMYALPQELQRQALQAAELRIDKLRQSADMVSADELARACALLLGYIHQRDAKKWRQQSQNTLYLMHELSFQIEEALEQHGLF